MSFPRLHLRHTLELHTLAFQLFCISLRPWVGWVSRKPYVRRARVYTPSLVRVVEKSTIPFPRLILTDGQIQTLHFQGLRFPGYSADSMYTKLNPTIFTDCRTPGSNEKTKMGVYAFWNNWITPNNPNRRYTNSFVHTSMAFAVVYGVPAFTYITWITPITQNAIIKTSRHFFILLQGLYYYKRIVVFFRCMLDF